MNQLNQVLKCSAKAKTCTHASPFRIRLGIPTQSLNGWYDFVVTEQEIRVCCDSPPAVSLQESNMELGQCVSRLEQEQAQRAMETEEERKQWASQQENEIAHQGRERREPITQCTVGQEEFQREREVMCG